MPYLLDEKLVFPHPNYASEEGLLAVGGELSVERLLLAYSNGIFPWFSDDDPVLWWSPDPRTVLFPEKFKLTKSLKQAIRNKGFEVKFDTDFKQVIRSCANTPRTHEDGTWITDSIIESYVKLYELGFAHSVETYVDNELVGGLYGISLGAAFFGESMFFKVSDASKVAFYYLVELAKAWNFKFIDAQINTPHLISLGAEDISRKQYLEILEQALEYDTKIGSWKQ